MKVLNSVGKWPQGQAGATERGEVGPWGQAGLGPQREGQGVGRGPQERGQAAGAVLGFSLGRGSASRVQDGPYYDPGIWLREGGLGREEHPSPCPWFFIPTPRCLCSWIWTVWWERDPATAPATIAAGEGDPGGCCSQGGTRSLCPPSPGVFRGPLCSAGLHKLLPGLCCSDEGLAGSRAALVER